MSLSKDQNDEVFEIQRRREALTPDIAGEMRLSARGDLLFAHGSPLLDRIVRIVVDPRPARRRQDDGERVGLRAVLDDGRQLWLGEASGAFATSLSISRQMWSCRLDLIGGVWARRVPLESTVAGDGVPLHAQPATIADIARHFAVAASCVASTAQPGNPEPDVPLLHRLRRLIRSSGVAAA